MISRLLFAFNKRIKRLSHYLENFIASNLINYVEFIYGTKFCLLL